MPQPQMVYVAGALTALTPERYFQLTKFYEELGDVCRIAGFVPFVPHTHGGKNHDNKPETIAYLRRSCCLAVSLSYLVVAYVGERSTGVGRELQLAEHAKKPIITLAEAAKFGAGLVSEMIDGDAGILQEIKFSDFEDAKIQLAAALEKFKRRRREEKLPEILSV